MKQIILVLGLISVSIVGCKNKEAQPVEKPPVVVIQPVPSEPVVGPVAPKGEWAMISPDFGPCPETPKYACELGQQASGKCVGSAACCKFECK